MRINRPADGFIGEIISPRYSRIGFIFNFIGVFILKFLDENYFKIKIKLYPGISTTYFLFIKPSAGLFFLIKSRETIPLKQKRNTTPCRKQARDLPYIILYYTYNLGKYEYTDQTSL
jgi:hypothetical protein